MKFKLQHKSPNSKARAGEFTTDHGTFQTPIFMPVGTAAAMKGIFHRDVKNEAKAEIILANTYHLYLRPGMEIMEKAGGVHKFSSWDGPMLTDSGGFQVFSLSGCRKLKEEGCQFQSHIDGSRHLFTPESVMDTQRIIGADIMMAFDECPPGDAPREYAAKSLAMTQRWLDRCFNRFSATEPKWGHSQSLFPIVQGCAYPDLRVAAAENVLQYNADGYAIGGLAVGEPTEVMYGHMSSQAYVMRMCLLGSIKISAQQKPNNGQPECPSQTDRIRQPPEKLTKDQSNLLTPELLL